MDDYALSLDPDDPAFDDKIEKKTQQLMRPVVEEVTLNFFERALLFSEETPVLGRIQITTEERRLANKKINSLKDQSVFEAFTPTEQNRAIELIRAGSIENPTDATKRKPGETITEFLERTGL